MAAWPGEYKSPGELLSFLRRLFHAPIVPLVRGATPQPVRPGNAPRFQFTPLREGRLQTGPFLRFLAISIHAPARGATAGPAGETGPVDFNSRPCERGDQYRRESFAPWYFNSRPCERGDRRDQKEIPGKQISIHAPARGATGGGVRHGLQVIISIHAPARGATKRCCNQHSFRPFQFTPLREGRRIAEVEPKQKRHFNSRPCERGDGSRESGGSWWPISIHAPARGATKWRHSLRLEVIFQFTPLREGRPVRSTRRAIRDIFQFTPLREGRPDCGSDRSP